MLPSVWPQIQEEGNRRKRGKEKKKGGQKGEKGGVRDVLQVGGNYIADLRKDPNCLDAGWGEHKTTKVTTL